MDSTLSLPRLLKKWQRRRQQSEVNHVAAAMNEMASTVQEVSRNATHAADVAQQASDGLKLLDLRNAKHD